MSEPATAPAATDRDPAAAEAVRARLAGTNINEKSLLATDYLNHFNEVVMMLDLVPDLPDCLEEVRAWRPKGYKAHFRDSAFSDRALAIEAYDCAPPEYRAPFEDTVALMDRLIAQALVRIEAAASGGDAERLRLATSAASRQLQKLIDVVSAIVNGEKPTISQEEIDVLMEQ